MINGIRVSCRRPAVASGYATGHGLCGDVVDKVLRDAEKGTQEFPSALPLFKMTTNELQRFSFPFPKREKRKKRITHFKKPLVKFPPLLSKAVELSPPGMKSQNDECT